MTVHPDRYSTSGVTARKAGVVVHTSEGSDQSYPVLIRLLASPGDRIIKGSNPPRKYGSAYHALTKNDPAASYDQVLGADAGPFAAPPLNKTWWHICIPGRAAQTRDEWLTDSSRQGILAVAEFIVDKAKVDGFPLERRTPAELRANLGGYCSHGDVSKAWGQTDHTDPGANFPWDVLAADIKALVTVTPPPPPLPPPTPGGAPMLVVVGRKANPADPRRWLWDGIAVHRLEDEAEYNRARLLFSFNPGFAELASPFWMEDAEIARFAARQEDMP